MPTYTAVTDLKIARQGAPHTILSGSTIEDFEDWPYENQMAMLRLGHVKQSGGQHAANLSCEGGYLHFKQEAPYLSPDVQQAQKKAALAPEVMVLDVVETADEAIVTDPEPEPMEAIKATKVVVDPRGKQRCPKCNFVCRGANNMQRHIAQDHAT
ncbi:MAG: hypothetical protein EOO40_00185 [Deltaproteobacteria bacterium]|nr:MAG: hypothetical protein EOO40_00185 [Deltaproteobacteria bacterium]